MSEIQRYEVSGFAMRPLKPGDECDENRFIEVVSMFDHAAAIAKMEKVCKGALSAKNIKIMELRSELQSWDSTLSAKDSELASLRSELENSRINETAAISQLVDVRQLAREALEGVNGGPLYCSTTIYEALRQIAGGE